MHTNYASEKCWWLLELQNSQPYTGSITIIQNQFTEYMCIQSLYDNEFYSKLNRMYQINPNINITSFNENDFKHLFKPTLLICSVKFKIETQSHFKTMLFFSENSNQVRKTKSKKENIIYESIRCFFNILKSYLRSEDKIICI